MKVRVFVLLAGAMLAAPSLRAQGIDTQRCPPGTENAFGIPDETRAAQDACQKAIDLFQYLAPQLGVSITGGNATLGQGGTLGGLGHFSAGLRINAVAGSLPQIEAVAPSVQGAVSTRYETDNQIIGLPTADLAIGVFRGIPLALTNVGGVDLLVSAAYLPEFDGEGVSVRVPGGSLKLGFGARVGVLQESLLVPGVSFTYLRRDLPTTNITATTNGDSLYVSDLSLKTNAWRVVASKHLLFLGVAVGAGQDRYDSSADIAASVAPQPPFTTTRFRASPTSPISQKLTRTNVFADLTMNLLILKLTGEIGQVSGGEISTFNTFNGKQPADSRVYGSIGARVGF
jgi:hypothetical protein